MVFKINSKDFLKALKDARANISPRRNYPIMDYQSYWLSVVFSYDVLEVSTVSRGGNLLTVNVPIQVVNSDKAPKSKVMVSQRLYGIVKTMDSQDLTIDLTADKMEIQHACGVVRFPTLTGSNIVVCGPLKFGHDRMIFLSTCDADELRLILSTLKPFMGDDEFRPVMKGICVKYTDEYTDYVASDGHRLCRISLPRKGCPDEILIPDTVVSVIQKVLPKTGKVSIYYKRDDLTTQIEAGNIRYIFKQTEGLYPNYQKVIPDDGDVIITLERQKLVRCLNRMTAIDHNKIDHNKYLSVHMSVDLDHISFSTDGQDGGDIGLDERVPILDRTSLGEFSAYIAPHGMLKSVSKLQSDLIMVSLKSSCYAPVVIHSEAPFRYGGDITVLIMPIIK